MSSPDVETSPESTTDELSELGRRLAAARRMDVEGVCPVCGRTFKGSAKRKYDRHSCAVIASRRKRNQEEKAASAGGS